MKKKLVVFILSIISIVAYSQAPIWQSYGSGLASNWAIRYLSAVNANAVWAIGAHGSSSTATNVFTKTGNGASFTTGTFLPDTNTYSASSISALDSNTAFISVYNKAGSGASGQILKTTNGGITWINVANDSMFLRAKNFPDFVHFWDANTGIALGDPNGHTDSTTTINEFEIWNTTNGGVSWIRVPDSLNLPPLANEYGVSNSYAVYGQKVWFGTSTGRVYSSIDSGKWVVYPTGLYGGANGLAFRDSLHGIVLGFQNSTTQQITVLNTADGGHTWNLLSTNNAIGTADFCTIPGTKGYMSVGVNGAHSLYATSVTHSDGVSWNVLEANTSNIEKMTTIQMTDTLHGWAGAYTTNGALNGMNKYIGPNVAGIERIKLNNNQRIVYPNPSSGAFSIDIESLSDMTEIQITDMLGNEVYKTTLNEKATNQTLHVNLSGIQKGIYLLRMQNGETNSIQKLIIQ